MEAIMKAFEKLEKREERRNQALNRMERKSTDTRKEEKVGEDQAIVCVLCNLVHKLYTRINVLKSGTCTI